MLTFIQGEIEKLDRILNLLDPRASAMDLPSLCQIIVERKNVAAKKSIFEEWSAGDLSIGAFPFAPPCGQHQRRLRHARSPQNHVPTRLRRRINFN